MSHDTRAAPLNNLLCQRENHVNFGVHFDRVAVQQRWLIAPLPDRVQCGLHKEWVSRNHLQLFDGAVLPDDGVQLHRAADARLPRKGRVERLNTIDPAGGLHVTTNVDAIWRDLWRVQCFFHFTNYTHLNTTSLPPAKHTGK